MELFISEVSISVINNIVRGANIGINLVKAKYIPGVLSG